MGKGKTPYKGIQAFEKRICVVDLMKRVDSGAKITDPFERRYINARNKQLARRGSVSKFQGHK